MTAPSRGRAQLAGYTVDQLALIRDFLSATRTRHTIFGDQLGGTKKVP